MVKQRPGWMLYHDVFHAMERFSDEQLGKIIRAACLFSEHGEIPDFSDDLLLDMTWNFLRPKIEVDDKKYYSRFKDSDASEHMQAHGENANAQEEYESMQTHRYRYRYPSPSGNPSPSGTGDGNPSSSSSANGQLPPIDADVINALQVIGVDLTDERRQKTMTEFFEILTKDRILAKIEEVAQQEDVRKPWQYLRSTLNKEAAEMLKLRENSDIYISPEEMEEIERKRKRQEERDKALKEAVRNGTRPADFYWKGDYDDDAPTWEDVLGYSND